MHWLLPVVAVLQVSTYVGTPLPAYLPAGQGARQQLVDSVSRRAVFLEASHALRVREDGTLKPFDAGGYARYLHELADEARATKRKVILIRAHGGMNAIQGALANSIRIIREIQDDTSTSYYPILINWNSGPLDSYFSSSASGRYVFLEGGPGDGIWWPRLISGPFYIAADLLGGTVRYVVFDFTPQVVNVFAPLSGQSHAIPMSGWTQPQVRPVIMPDTSLGRDCWPGGSRATAFATNVVTFPTRIIGGLGVESFGAPAWTGMRRRAKLLLRAEFEPPEELSLGVSLRPAVEAKPGPVGELLDTLQNVLRVRPDLRVELIGHSMGAIIASEIAEDPHGIEFDDIVFLAAAVSLRDFRRTVVPYLKAHPATQFYNVTLHPAADFFESSTFLAPRGSLLEWIDRYLDRPETEVDAVMGKHNNVMRGMDVFSTEVRNRVHQKTFGFYDGSGYGPGTDLPHTHGGFNAEGVPFWRPSFWKPRSVEPSCPLSAPVAPRFDFP